MPGTFSPPPLVSDPDMHHGTCVTHVPWCMPGSLNSGFLWCRCRGKRSRHSRRMRNPQFCVSGKRPIEEHWIRWDKTTWLFYMSPGGNAIIIVRRAGLLWSQQDFEWRWSVPLFKCLTVLEFSFILFDLCLLITFFNFIMNYIPIVTFWIFTYHKIWILLIMFCFVWCYWIIYFLACLEVSWRVVS